MPNPRCKNVTLDKILSDQPPPRPNTTVRLSPSLKDAVRAMAVQSQRSLSGQITVILKEAVAKQMGEPGVRL